MNGVGMVTHRQAARPCAGRDHGALHPSLRPVDCRRRRPGIGAHPCGPGRKGRRMREGATMPRVDLTARLARDAKRQDRDTILFDRAQPGFGVRIHPSGRRVWIVQARIEGRSRRIVIAWHGEMEFSEAGRRARDMLGRIRAGENPADEIGREKETPDLAEVRRRVTAALRAALEAIGAKDRTQLHQVPNPARLRQNAARPNRVRPRHSLRLLARGRRRHPLASTHRLPLQRSAKSALARYWRRRPQPARLENGPRAVPLGKAAKAHIDALPRPCEPDDIL